VVLNTKKEAILTLRLAINGTACACNENQHFRWRALRLSLAVVPLLGLPQANSFVVVLNNKKEAIKASFLLWYPQANSNCCLHRERVLS